MKPATTPQTPPLSHYATPRHVPADNRATWRQIRIWSANGWLSVKPVTASVALVEITDRGRLEAGLN